jgi:hypothetical protein
MGASAELRRQVESALAARIPAALTFRPPVSPELISCGLAEVDALLGGGLPLGAITELTGSHSSGRTTLALSTLAGITRQGESCAYVDASDSLHPLSAAAMGVDLRRLLWVRTGEARAGEAAVAAGSPFPAAAPAPAVESKRLGGAGWCHPRNETIGLDHAVGKLFQTVPKEKVDFTPRCSEAVPRQRVQPVCFTPLPLSTKLPDQPQPRASVFRETSRETFRGSAWTRLDQALRATDLLLCTGGFRALVLDLGDISPEQARRVPLATWYRFRLQAEKSRTLFLLVTRVPCANSCAAVSLHCRQSEIDWQQAAHNSPPLLGGVRYSVSVERSRAVDPARRKSVASAEAGWSSAAPWSR